MRPRADQASGIGRGVLHTRLGPNRQTRSTVHLGDREPLVSRACFFSDRNHEKEPIMRPENAARRAIIREWMLLPREKRQSEEQAAAFALKAIEKHDFRGSGDRQRRVMAWLMPRIGKS